MKKMLVLGTLLFVAIIAFRVAERLSADAIGMGLGVLFGVLAGIPTALLLLAAARRREDEMENSRRGSRGRQLGHEPPYGALPQQPPVIILAGNGMPMPANGLRAGGNYDIDGYPALPAPSDMPRRRQFRMVGATDEEIDDFAD